MVGTLTLFVQIQGVAMPMRAYILCSKGPPLIMGFTFLEDNALLVDCTDRTLTKKGCGSQVKCLPLQEAQTSQDTTSSNVSADASCQPVYTQCCGRTWGQAV